MTLSHQRAGTILDRFAQQRVLVVGDIILDRYVSGTADRISPEAPVPVVRATRESHVLGGASNVAWNIRSLGAKASMSGILGKDAAGETMAAMLAECEVSTDAVLVSEDAITTRKTRVIADRQQVVRVDWDNETTLSGDAVDEFIRLIDLEMAQVSGVILEDYGKGAVSQPVVDAVLSRARERGIPTAFDPKDNHELNVRGVTIITPNRKEAFSAAGVKDHTNGGDPFQDEPLLRAGRLLREKWGPDQLLITLGPQGMLLLSDEDPHHVPTRAREVFDVSGAGDTVVAVCLLALASGASPVEAAELANVAAGIVVAKLGTAVTTPEEILESLS